jgi:hypothetical protein
MFQQHVLILIILFLIIYFSVSHYRVETCLLTPRFLMYTSLVSNFSSTPIVSSAMLIKFNQVTNFDLKFIVIYFTFFKFPDIRLGLYLKVYAVCYFSLL